MSRLRLVFLALRFTAYTGVLCFTAVHHRGHLNAWQWMFAAIVYVFGTWDYWKRPDASAGVMRRGVWVELFAVIALAWIWSDILLLFLVLSPLMRSCVHLRLWNTGAVFGVGIAGLLSLSAQLGSPHPVTYAIVVTLTGIGVYTSVLGALLHHRDQLRRAASMSAFEREQRLKEEERGQMADRLHDTMGQYWTAVLRALDVAQHTDGEQRARFIQKAYEAATDGLQEMRAAVRDGHAGTKSVDEWMDDLCKGVVRVRELTKVDVQLEVGTVDWTVVAHPVDIAEAITRIALESMTNAVRHGYANHIRIQLMQANDSLSLVVQDDGRGINGAPANAGIGMLSMQSLSNRSNGTLQVTSSGNGTTVRFSLPLTHSLSDQTVELVTS